MSDTASMPLPPATFDFLVSGLMMQAQMHLGLFRMGDEPDQPAPDTRLARHTIDMLAMLQEKTRGNLSIEEQRLLENSLTELRFRYVQVMSSPKNTIESTPETTTESSPE